MVQTQVGWNVLDEEQRKDLEFVLSAPNRAGRIRECVRRVRLMMQSGIANVAQAPVMTPAPIVMSDAEISDDDIADGLL